MTPKALWKDLEFKFGAGAGAGASTSEKGLVKKYVNFRIHSRSRTVKKAQEFNTVRDSLGDLGMVIDDKFHINMLISKLPRSWKKTFNKLIGKEYVSGLAMVMKFLRAEEGRRFKRLNFLLQGFFSDWSTQV